MQIYTGTVTSDPGPPFNGKFGPKVSVELQMDDPNAPKSSSGQMKMYKDPNSNDGRFMGTLRQGDRVNLVFTDNGNMQYYNFVTHNNGANQNSQPVARQQNNAQVTQAPVRGTASTRIWLPLNDDQLTVYTNIVEQEIEIIAHIMSLVAQRFGEQLDRETLWKISVTMYINADKKFNPNFIVIDDQPDVEPDGGYSQDTEVREIVF